MRLDRQLSLAVWVSLFIIAACLIAVYADSKRVPRPTLQTEHKRIWIMTSKEFEAYAERVGLFWSRAERTALDNDLSCDSFMNCVSSAYDYCNGSRVVIFAFIEDESESTCMTRCASGDHANADCSLLCDPCTSTDPNCQGPCLEDEPDPTPEPCVEPCIFPTFE